MGFIFFTGGILEQENIRYDYSFTGIPNIILDYYLHHFGDNRAILVVLLKLIRFTIGWNQTKKRLSFSFLKKITGIKSDNTIAKAIKELKELNLIQVEKNPTGNRYDLNVPYITKIEEILTVLSLQFEKELKSKKIDKQYLFDLLILEKEKFFQKYPLKENAPLIVIYKQKNTIENIKFNHLIDSDEDSTTIMSIVNHYNDYSEVLYSLYGSTIMSIDIKRNNIKENNIKENIKKENIGEENGGAVMCMTPKVKRESLLRKNKKEHSFEEKKENVSRNEEERPMNDFLDDFNNHKKEKYKNAQLKKKDNVDVLKNAIVEKFGLENLPLVVDYITLHKSFKNGTPQKISFIENIEDFCPLEKVITTMQKVIDSHTRLKNISLYGGQWHEWNLKNFSKDGNEFKKKTKFEKKEKSKKLARKGKLIKKEEPQFWQSYLWICPDCGMDYPGEEIGTGLVCKCGTFIDINPQEI